MPGCTKLEEIKIQIKTLIGIMPKEQTGDPETLKSYMAGNASDIVVSEVTQLLLKLDVYTNKDDIEKELAEVEKGIKSLKLLKFEKSEDPYIFYKTYVANKELIERAIEKQNEDESNLQARTTEIHEAIKKASHNEIGLALKALEKTDAKDLSEMKPLIQKLKDQQNIQKKTEEKEKKAAKANAAVALVTPETGAVEEKVGEPAPVVDPDVVAAKKDAVKAAAEAAKTKKQQEATDKQTAALKKLSDNENAKEKKQKANAAAAKGLAGPPGNPAATVAKAKKKGSPPPNVPPPPPAKSASTPKNPPAPSTKGKGQGKKPPAPPRKAVSARARPKARASAQHAKTSKTATQKKTKGNKQKGGTRKNRKNRSNRGGWW